jgi:hypothetical protein
MLSPSIQVSASLRAAIQNAEVAADAFQRAGLTDRANKLEEYIENARKLRFSVGVVALAKRGKSTLINGLLGRRDDILAPIDMFPATSVVSCFANGPKESARVLFEGDDENAPGKDIRIEDIKQYACEEHNPDNRKCVKVIEVVGSFPRLGEDVVLVDTPGADNALTQVHDIVLLEFLPKLDAVLFLIAAGEPLVASEVELLKHIRKNDVSKLLFVMNKVDAVEAVELQEGIQHNLKVLAEAGFGNAAMFEVSAKNYLQTGSDAGVERLLSALGATIAEGRAGIIAERLGAITEFHVKEAAADIRSAIESSELTLEQIEQQHAQLEALRVSRERGRDETERKFRASWRAAFDELDNALVPLQRQLIADYTELVEKTPAFKLDLVGKMINTDVIKRLDEQLQAHTDRLSESLSATTRALQTDVLGAMDIAPREATAILTRKRSLEDVAGPALAGVPALAGAAVVGSLPGLVGSAIISSAPSVAAVVWWNPLTWAAAAATSSASAGVATSGAAVTALLTPLALVGTPLLLGYAGLRAFSAWRHQVGRTKNELSIAVKDFIIASIDETRRNLRQARVKDNGILEEFRDSTAANINSAKRQLKELELNRPTPERLIELKLASKVVARLRAPEPPLQESEAALGERLFS